MYVPVYIMYAGRYVKAVWRTQDSETSAWKKCGKSNGFAIGNDEFLLLKTAVCRRIHVVEGRGRVKGGLGGWRPEQLHRRLFQVHQPGVRWGLRMERSTTHACLHKSHLCVSPARQPAIQPAGQAALIAAPPDMTRWLNFNRLLNGSSFMGIPKKSEK